MTDIHYREEAERARRDSRKYYYRWQKEAKLAAHEYGRAREYEKFARYLMRCSSTTEDTGTPADWERSARLTRRLADSSLKLAFRYLESARLANDRVRTFERLAGYHDV